MRVILCTAYCISDIYLKWWSVQLINFLCQAIIRFHGRETNIMRLVPSAQERFSEFLTEHVRCVSILYLNVSDYTITNYSDIQVWMKTKL